MIIRLLKTAKIRGFYYDAGTYHNVGPRLARLLVSIGKAEIAEEGAVNRTPTEQAIRAAPERATAPPQRQPVG